MHYPVMTEKQVADRWQVSLKTLRRWRSDNEGPIVHKLSHHVRNHEADILELERQSAQHWRQSSVRVNAFHGLSPIRQRTLMTFNHPISLSLMCSTSVRRRPSRQMHRCAMLEFEGKSYRLIEAYLPHRHQPRDVIVQASVLPWKNLRWQ